jgi:hypothetical protein
VSAVPARTVPGDHGEQRKDRHPIVVSQFLSRSGLDVSESTLSANESGARPMGVHRLWTLCRELPVDPGTLVGNAHRRVVGSVETVHIDLIKLAHTTAEALGPLRAWAAARSREDPRTRWLASVPFHTAALESMAVRCGLTSTDLLTVLMADEAATW